MPRTSQLPRIFVTLLLTLLCITFVRADESAAADEVLLNNGSRIIGTVKSVRDYVVQIDTDFAGTLEIPLDKIASLQTVEPVVIQLADESVIEGQPLQIENSQLVVADASGASTPQALEQLLLVNPEPWELGRGYNWTGLAALAFTLERGNSKTDELDYKLESVWRSDDDRYTIKANGETDEANDVKSADNWTIIGKYDYFFDGLSYWGVNAYAEQDEFADLNLRYYVGPYIGREFYTDPVFSLSAEVGASYVNEDFDTAEDQDYPGGNWAFHIGSNYLGGDSKLYIDQLGIWNLDEASDVIVNTTFGLSFPLIWRLEAAAEILLEYDSGAVDDIEELDETYKFRIGYTW